MDEHLILRFLRRRQKERDRLHNRQLNRTRLRSIRDASDPFAMNEEKFKGIYRLSKEMVMGLIEELRPHMVEARRSTAIPIELKVLCALHFYGHGCYQKSTGNHSNLGLCQTSVSKCVDEVTTVLNADGVLSKWVNFPLMRGERNSLIQKNYQSFQIPGVIGYVDGTHVAIKAPKDEEHVFLNRKSYHSINVMIVSTTNVCDSEMIILNSLARFPGSCHDSYIWNKSALKELFMSIWARGEQCWLLGDSGYPNEPWLQTPILSAPDDSAEAHYSTLHVRAWSVVQRCIGLLKARFRCLQRHRVLEYEPLKVCYIVNACAVLHNMCLRGGLTDFVLGKEPDEGDMASELFQCEQMPQMALLQAGRAVRERLVNRLYC